MPLSRRPTLLPLALVLVVFSASARADPSGIADQMTAMFDTMLNYTNPTAHLGQRRGVVTGGSLSARNRIASESLWHFVPPSYSAGCGGIDLFAGSFSFISAEQFQNLLRSMPIRLSPTTSPALAPSWRGGPRCLGRFRHRSARRSAFQFSALRQTRPSARTDD